MRLAPNKARPWLLQQDEIWVTKTGEVRHVRDLDRDHVLNLLAFLLRDSRNGSPTQVVQTPLVKALLARTRPHPYSRSYYRYD